MGGVVFTCFYLKIEMNICWKEQGVHMGGAPESDMSRTGAVKNGNK